ncbi:sporulation related protein [Neolewinella xylanilytica]|uniref:Sporulation related protein n=1 Tax=Neolewinella xylanilytica TaxID=1514080 RepID=A0A2S6I1Z0_9BACT|nr:SPOR domain-containing protein [Neolewinella xylanilytica]PPK85101.1 sporulation related protein [Neolewinella xylanilytica]
MRALLVLTLLTAASAVSAQRMVAVSPDEDVSRVLNLFSDINERESKVEGWRVQLLATTDRQQLETTERKFRADYPSVTVDWVHNKPYYKLRAGAFFTRQEAERLRQNLSQEYEGVYLVKDQVEESELLKMY